MSVLPAYASFPQPPPPVHSPRSRSHPYASMTTASSTDKRRKDWMSSKLRDRRELYTSDKDLLLFSATWNVNGRPPDAAEDLDKVLKPSSEHGNREYDLYMLGFQEVQSLTGVDSFRTDTLKGDAWRETLLKHFTESYQLIAERQLVGVIVFVFLRQNHVPFLSDVQLSYAATGFLNAIGNKGAVAVRFRLYDHTIACVSCHLAAHTQNVERRNQDFRDVVRKAVFLPSENSHSSHSTEDLLHEKHDYYSQPQIVRARTTLKDSRPPTSNSTLPAMAIGTGSWLGSVASQAAAALSDMSAGANSAALNDPNAIQILRHDVVFWLGDFNYRIDAPIQYVMECINDLNFDSLFKADQLQNEMKTCDIFAGFKEGKVKFAPTYKFNRYSNEYALDENGELKRTPAYTDRILWRTGGDTRKRVRVQQLEYKSAPSVKGSDHRPVYALFQMAFGVENVAKKREEEEKLVKEVEQNAHLFRPVLHISAPYMDFGDVFYNQKCQRKIGIINRSETPCVVNIIRPKDSQKWLVFDEGKYKNVELAPGQSVTVTASVLITSLNGSAIEVASQGCLMDTRLTVTGEPGRMREYIHLRGRYVATCRGLSLEKLSMLPGSVLRLRTTKPRKGTTQPRIQPPETSMELRQGPRELPLSIPKEIWLLVDALVRVQKDDHEMHMNRCPGIFVRRADEKETQRALSFIDRAERIPCEISGYAVADCMLDVLKQLHEPVIPRYAYKRALEAAHMDDEEMVHAVVDLLPPLNVNVFWYIISFLCQTALVRTRNESAIEIARAFGKVLLTPERSNNPRESRLRTAFIRNAISFQLRRRNLFQATIDLGDPSSHPRIPPSSVLG